MGMTESRTKQLRTEQAPHICVACGAAGGWNGETFCRNCGKPYDSRTWKDDMREMTETQRRGRSAPRQDGHRSNSNRMLTILIVCSLLCEALCQSSLVYDPRLKARVSYNDLDGTLVMKEARLVVEDAPATPQTRDPGHGRPPFTSSRLHFASSVPSRIELQCISGSQTCSFGSHTNARGVGYEANTSRSADGQRLSFTLPAPASEQLAAHFWLNATLLHGAGPTKFARGLDANPNPNRSPNPYSDFQANSSTCGSTGR